MIAGEERNVGADSSREAKHSVRGDRRGRKRVQYSQHRGGVGAASTKTAADRNAFFDLYLEAARPTGFLAIRSGGAKAKIVIGILVAHRITAKRSRSGGGSDSDRIGKLDSLKHCLDGVIAIVVSTEDPECEIDLRLSESPSRRAHQAVASAGARSSLIRIPRRAK